MEIPIRSRSVSCILLHSSDPLLASMRKRLKGPCPEEREGETEKNSLEFRIKKVLTKLSSALLTRRLLLAGGAGRAGRERDICEGKINTNNNEQRPKHESEHDETRKKYDYLKN